MKRLARYFFLTFALLLATSAVAAEPTGEAADAPLPTPAAPATASAAAAATDSAGRAPRAASGDDVAVAVPERKAGERQEKDQRDALFLLFLQVLRAPK